jgi:hypothetical protein
MDLLLTITACSLIAIACAPLLLLGLYLLADALGFSTVAERLLDACSAFLTLQGYTGGIVNLLGGLALCGLGVWGIGHAAGLMLLLPALLIPFGLWRSWLGLCVLKSMHETD